jgi:arylsulfatase A-like enzyme
MHPYVSRMGQHVTLIASLLIASLFSFAQKKKSNSNSNRPNIIYIMADDMGYADLSCYGRKEYSTPNLDKLASEGITFMNAYAAAPVCTPTRAAFITGRYSARVPVGLREPLTADRDSLIGLDPATPSIGKLLKNGGYETALIGKWHLGFINEFGPNKNGFDYFYGIRSGFTDYVNHTGDGGTPDLYENEKPIIQKGYLTTLLKEQALQYLKQPHNKPFFLSLDFNAPHWPWEGPDDPAYPDTMDMRAGGSVATYAKMMIALDDAVGEIIRFVDEQSYSKNTLIIFTSDNGGEKFSDMGPYQGKKLSLWEGGIRVPAFVRWTGIIKPNLVTGQVATTMDWTATILAAANVSADPQFPLDGINLLPVCTQKSPSVSRTLFWRTVERSHHKAIRDGIWKYLVDEKGEYLFDLSTDPAEKVDVKTKYPDILERMKTKYATWEASVLPSFLK